MSGGDLLVRSLGIDWLIIFDFSDTNASYSYIIYENGLEIRCVIQEEESEFYMDGHIQGFEKELLDFSTRYLHEYKENGKAQKQWITDLEFSLLNTKDDNTGEYYKYYYLNVSGKLIYHTHLARLLLIELFITYIGFEIFDSNYIPYSLFKIRFKNEPNYEIYLKLALTGDTSAQNKIGEMFEKGLGVEKNYEVAQEWFQKSSDQDDDVGMLNLGLLLLKNEGDNNIVVATDLIKKSVEKGNIQAQTILAEMYEQGVLLNQNYDFALNLYKKSAKKGCAIAPYKIGLMYEFGRGVAIDLRVAKRWYHQAVNAFNEDAQIRLDQLIQYFGTLEKK